MLKKLFLAIFLLFFFVSSANSQIIQVPPPETYPTTPQFSQDKLVVTYIAKNSPKELSNEITQRKMLTKALPGLIRYQIKVLTGKEKPISYYENKLVEINTGLKKAGVVKSESTSFPWGTTTSIVTLKKGTNLNEALKKIKEIPEVQNVDYNYFRFTSRISSEDSTITPNKFLIQYKEGQTPVDLSSDVNRRVSAQNTILGTARVAAENVSLQAQGEDTPEEKLLRIYNVANDVGLKSEKPLISQNVSQAPDSLQNSYIVTTDGSTNVNETLEKYATLPEVSYIRPVRKIYPFETPNDPYYGQEWGLQKIQAPTTWDRTKGSDSVIVSVNDTGVDYNHPDLSTNVVKGPNYFANNNDPMDDCGHGTHVAGTIGALTNNGKGVAGINWNIKMIAIKIMGPLSNGKCGSENDTTITQGIIYAADNGAKAINMSLGGPGPCPADYQQAINYARSKGAAVIVAAGNNSQNASSFAPANCNGVITVGATDQNDNRASFSNYGSVVTLSAPGVDIISTYSQGGQAVYANENGTSMAAPHVAGAAGLLLSIKPNLSPDEIKNILVSNADTVSTDLPIGPRLNLARAINSLAPDNQNPTPTDQPQNPTPTVPNTTPIASTPSPSPSPSNPTPTLSSSKGTMKVTLVQPGIGVGGNTNPISKSRVASIEFINNKGEVVSLTTTPLTYANGVFSAEAPLLSVPAGTYQIKVNFADGSPTLKKAIPGFYTIKDSTNNITLPTTTLTVGDLTQDGILDILDYNIIVNCIINNNCNNTTADFDDDGIVDEKDLNIFLRQLRERGGD